MDKNSKKEEKSINVSCFVIQFQVINMANSCFDALSR